ncbi:MAG: exonuclease domain-containing protein [Ignavibacteriales bacterium]|nr:exonuclease domain-containing protein [Ignavibacteriales bacterium]
MEENKLTEIPFEEAEYSVFDFETTGTSAHHDKVIEIGIVKIKNGKIVDTFSSFINPGRPVPFYITQITGITTTDVQDAPYFDEVYLQIKEFIGDTILTAHNLNFDYSFLKHECLNQELEVPANNSICTLRLARRMYPQFPSKSLGNLVKQLKIRHRDVHRGLGDATATAKILLRMFKQLREEHDIDTVSDLISFQKHSSSTEPYRIIKKKLLDDVVNIPGEPGVYFFKNAKEEIIYIGKAKVLKERLRNYFMSTAMRKSKEIVRKASGLGYQTTNTELTALIVEAELIKKHLPKQNKMLKKYPRSYFIKILFTHNFPSVEVSSTINFDGNNYFGPYPNRDTANSLKEIIDKTFLLRECSDKEFNKKRRCYLADIERCYSPCTESDIKPQYAEELDRVNDFLCGNNQSAVDRLLNRMKELSAKQKYEEAGQIRDVVNSILNQLNKSSILAEPINKANVLIEILGSRKNDYMLLLDGKMYLKNYILNEKDRFDDILNEFFAGDIQLIKELTEKDLESLRIALSWLVRNRNRIKVHYLKEYQSVEQLGPNLIFNK